MNSLPPQAYTRDTLTSAYEWLRAQPISIRELALDADTLVALYLQARRRGQVNAAGDNFKEDLKVLAQGLKQFEDPKAAVKTEEIKAYGSPSVNISTVAGAPLVTSSPSVNSHMPQVNAPPRHTVHSQVAAQQPVNNQNQTPSHYSNAAPIQTATSASIQLDAHTQHLITDVQKRLNLTSTQEVLRMLVTLGYEKIRDIMPKL